MIILFPGNLTMLHMVSQKKQNLVISHSYLEEDINPFFTDILVTKVDS